jgi:hypothetical protein
MSTKDRAGATVEATWLHLADLNCGRPVTAGWDQARVLEKLLVDVAERVQDPGYPAPRMVFVAGGLTYSAADEEFSAAGRWLDRLAEVLAVRPENIITVPGEQDVDIAADRRDPTTGRAVHYVREGVETIDDVLREGPGREGLAARLRGYLELERRRCDAAGGDLWWARQRMAGAVPLRVLGLNTVLVSGVDNQGKLFVGEEQLAELVPADRDEPRLVIALSHHSAEGGWLADEDEVAVKLGEVADVHLFSRTRGWQASELRAAAGGRRCLGLGAGAVQRVDAAGLTAVEGFSYNFCAVLRAPEGRCSLRVWSRTWTTGNYFVNDRAQGGAYRDYLLAYRFAPPAAAVALSPAPGGRRPVRRVLELHNVVRAAPRKPSHPAPSHMELRAAIRPTSVASSALERHIVGHAVDASVGPQEPRRAGDFETSMREFHAGGNINVTQNNTRSETGGELIYAVFVALLVFIALLIVIVVRHMVPWSLLLIYDVFAVLLIVLGVGLSVIGITLLIRQRRRVSPRREKIVFPVLSLMGGVWTMSEAEYLALCIAAYVAGSALGIRFTPDVYESFEALFLDYRFIPDPPQTATHASGRAPDAAPPGPRRCGADEALIRGACTPCPPGTTPAVEACVALCTGDDEWVEDPSVPGKRRGTCERRCPKDKQRRAGLCQTPCPGEVDPDGGCVCPTGEENFAEGCRVSCPQGALRTADGSCVCPAGFEVFAGACQRECPGQTRRGVDGVCACPEGQEPIGELCLERCEGQAQRNKDGTCGCPPGQEEFKKGVCEDLCLGGKRRDREGDCVCPTGMEDFAGTCTSPCLGGKQRMKDGECACPEGTELFKDTCKQPCIGGAQRAGDGTCACPEGTQLLDKRCQRPCPKEGPPVEDRSCFCPAYSEWVGSLCVEKCERARMRDAEGQCVPRSCPPGMKYIHGGDAADGPILAFCMDLTEVTVRECMGQNCGALQYDEDDKTRQNCNVGQDNRQDHPVNCITQRTAKRFCQHDNGKELPTVEQWRWAAVRGHHIDPTFLHPWGKQPPTCLLAVHRGCTDSMTKPVRSVPAGNSPDGLFDMAGNVAEWTTAEDVALGGSWYSKKGQLTYRQRQDFGGAPHDVGFRCVKNF